MRLLSTLLACSSPEPAPPAPEPVVAPEPAPVAAPEPEPVSPPDPYASLPAAVRDPSLSFGAYELDQIVAQQAAVAAIGTSDEALCDAVIRSTTLSARLAENLGARYMAADEPPHYFESIQALSGALPGMHVAPGAEGVYGAPDLEGLGKKAGKTPGGALLLAAHGWLGDFGKSTFLDWTTDLSGCAQPGRSAERLTAVADAWTDAPECLKEALKAPIAEDLRLLAGWDCYCGPAADVARDVAVLEPVLDRLPDLGGPEAKARIAADLAAGATRYETAVCGG